MEVLDNFSGQVLTSESGDASYTAFDTARRELARIFPEASSKRLYSALGHADELLTEALDDKSKETDDIGKLVMVSSALAVTLQGRRNLVGRWRGEVVKKGNNPTAFWQSLVDPKTRITDPEDKLPKEDIIPEDDIVYGAATKDEPEIAGMAAVIIHDLQTEGGLFEAMPSNVDAVYSLALTDEEILMLEHMLVANGHGHDHTTSYYVGRKKAALLSTIVSRNIYKDDQSGLLAKGTLAHEIGHGFTSGIYNYHRQGRYLSAKVLGELLAEHTRAHLGYPSQSYATERALQYAVNDVAGYDIVDTVIGEYREYTGDDIQHLIQNYAARLSRTAGFLVSGLVLGASPENYLTDSNYMEPHDINFLNSDKAGRYRALGQYALPDAKPSLMHSWWQTGDGGLWHKPSEKSLRQRELFSRLLSDDRRTTVWA